MDTDSSYEHELARTLSLFDITMIGVGAMIGAGIFVLTGVAAGIAGPALILVFLVNGIITSFTALCYAELGSAMPGAGGGYLWVREGLPGPSGFVSGWMDWFAHTVAGSLYALGFGAYFALILELMGISFFGLSFEITIKLFAVIVICLFLLINFKGVSETGMAENVFTVAKIVILAIFIGSGLWVMYNKPDFGFSNFSPFIPNGLGSIFIACGLTFIAFEGYEIIAQAGEEVRNPRKNVPRAVILSILIVLPIYCLVAFVSLGALTVESGTTWQYLGEFQELGLVEAAKQFMPFGVLLLIIGGLLSTMSALNATTYSSTRVSFAMARDKFLPRKIATIHRKNRTPYVALFFSGMLMIFMSVSVPLEDVASATSLMFLFLFMLVNLSAIMIRRKIGDQLDYGYRMKFFPIIPIVAMCANMALAVFLFQFSPTAWYVTILWVLIGLGIYFAYSRRHYVKTEQWKRYAHLKRDIEEK